MLSYINLIFSGKTLNNIHIDNMSFLTSVTNWLKRYEKITLKIVHIKNKYDNETITNQTVLS